MQVVLQVCEEETADIARVRVERKMIKLDNIVLLSTEVYLASLAVRISSSTKRSVVTSMSWYVRRQFLSQRHAAFINAWLISVGMHVATMLQKKEDKKEEMGDKTAIRE